jgi:hypothetical protein
LRGVDLNSSADMKTGNLLTLQLFNRLHDVMRTSHIPTSARPAPRPFMGSAVARRKIIHQRQSIPRHYSGM